VKKKPRRPSRKKLANQGLCISPDQYLTMTADWREIGKMTMDVLPDDVLIHVFNCYMAQASRVESWHTLVHVCRRWREVVFGSPRHLNLRIACTNKMRVREKLDVWPAIPIVVSGYCDSPSGLDHNIEAALEHNDRICRIKFVSAWYMKRVFAALEEPFSALTDLELWSIDDDAAPVFPNPVKFLGGSSHLRSLELGGISIPGLPNLLLSLTDLVELRIDLTSESGFLPPREIVTGVSALSKLKVFALEFEYDTSRERESQHAPPPTPAVLPALTSFKFKGVSEYLEDLVTLIDAPQLDHLDIAFYSFNQVIFDTPHLIQLISRIPKLQAPVKAHIGFDDPEVWIEFSSPIQASSNVLTLGILCVPPDPQFPCMAQFCRSPFFPLPTLESLYIGGGRYGERDRQYRIENTRWLDFLEPFATVKNLYLSKEFAPRVAPALRQLVGGRATEVLPTLQNVFVEEFQPSGLIHEAIGQFITSRQRSDYPIVISDWAGIRPDMTPYTGDPVYVL
jgi:F-box-like